MRIEIASTDSDITACYPVLKELRPELRSEDFLPAVRRLEQTGYRLACARVADRVTAVAGFHIGENLARGRFLYVDDLVTLPAGSSQGIGARFLDWLKGFGIQAGCGQLHLDSAVARTDAHRFYRREGLIAAGMHFRMPLVNG